MRQYRTRYFAAPLAIAAMLAVTSCDNEFIVEEPKFEPEVEFNLSDLEFDASGRLVGDDQKSSFEPNFSPCSFKIEGPDWLETQNRYAYSEFDWQCKANYSADSREAVVTVVVANCASWDSNHSYDDEVIAVPVYEFKQSFTVRQQGRGE